MPSLAATRAGRAGRRAATSASLALLAAALSAATTACGGPSAATVGSSGAGHAGKGGPATDAAPRSKRLEVVASAYPLAQLLSYIGGRDVKVVDLAGPGVQPQGLHLSRAQARTVASAPLVVDVGDGYQPAVEHAAASSGHELALLSVASPHVARPYQFWLDPSLMARAATAAAAAMSRLDPAAARRFDNGALDFQSVASSLSSDLQSNFSACTRQTFVTEDDAFARMASAFGLTDVAVSRSGIAAATSTVRSLSLPAVFAEAGNPSGLVRSVARRTGARVASLDPLEVAPEPGATALSYFAVMEQNLTNLEGPLACDTSGSFS